MAHPERERLADTTAGWKRWGPDLSERTWGRPAGPDLVVDLIARKEAP